MTAVDRGTIPPKRRAALERLKAEAVSNLGIPAKDLGILREGRLRETAGVLAVRSLDRPTILVLSGGPGVGKTLAASAWLWDGVQDDDAWEWWEPGPYDYTGASAAWSFRGPTGLLVTAADLSRWRVYEPKEMAKLLKPSRLVLDDAGAEFAEARLLATVDEVVNCRYAERKELLITTNLAAPDFRERYGQRVTDRLLESGRFVGLGNKSLRGKEAP